METSGMIMSQISPLLDVFNQQILHMPHSMQNEWFLDWFCLCGRIGIEICQKVGCDAQNLNISVGKCNLFMELSHFMDMPISTLSILFTIFYHENHKICCGQTGILCDVASKKATVKGHYYNATWVCSIIYCTRWSAPRCFYSTHSACSRDGPIKRLWDNVIRQMEYWYYCWPRIEENRFCNRIAQRCCNFVES